MQKHCSFQLKTYLDIYLLISKTFDKLQYQNFFCVYLTFIKTTEVKPQKLNFFYILFNIYKTTYFLLLIINRQIIINIQTIKYQLLCLHWPIDVSQLQIIKQIKSQL